MKEINDFKNTKEDMLETLKRIDCNKNESCILITHKEIGSTINTLNSTPKEVLIMFGAGIDGYVSGLKKEHRDYFLETIIGFLGTRRGK